MKSTPALSAGVLLFCAHSGQEERAGLAGKLKALTPPVVPEVEYASTSAAHGCLINGPIPLLDVWAHRVRVRQRDIDELDIAG